MIKMKKILFAFAAMIVLISCGNKQTAAPAEGDEASNEVAFEVAKNYFFKNDQEIHSYLCNVKKKKTEQLGYEE